MGMDRSPINAGTVRSGSAAGPPARNAGRTKTRGFGTIADYRGPDGNFSAQNDSSIIMAHIFCEKY